ncbi:MAG: mechanosensitive ion channel family protein [Acetobacteraceae bacterium]|nr:mechanosensitive ion channel family protein [Acetobacteraceae bacterium]
MPMVGAPVFDERYLNSSAGAIHRQIVALARAIPDLPNQFELAASRDSAAHGKHGRVRALFTLAVFGTLGLGFEWLFRKITLRVRRRLDGYPIETVRDRMRLIAVRSSLVSAGVVVFALGSLGPFLVLDWDPTVRGTVLAYLIAAIVIRLAVAIGDFLFAPDHQHFRIIPTDTVAARFWCRRVTLFVSWSVLGLLILHEYSALGFSFNGLQLVAYTLSLGLMAIALESVWRGRIASGEAAEGASAERRRVGRTARNTALTVGIVLLWVFGVLASGSYRASVAFWLILVMIILPLAVFVTRRAVENLLQPPGARDTVENPQSVVAVCLERGIRALLIIGAALLLAWGWGVDIIHLAGQDTRFARIAHGVLSAVIILLVADVLWHAITTAIDSTLAQTADPGLPNTDEARRRARLHTLLPIFRNVLFVVVIAVAALMALAAMGVEIGPLIAGMSVVGVAIGFGAQTFVRDVIAGMFYLLDDAFRVGEYIQSGNYKGTVEGFSIRSVRLRHHRGPVYTVPFGLLGAIQNQSRDWVIDKLAVGITYGSDLEKARKLIKQIGLELQKDPEFAPLIIEPLKMQGVEQLGDFAVQIRAKMMTLPGEQFVIRRKAYAMIKKAFDENGIKFAFPTVQVAGESEPATAAVAHHGLGLTQPAAA